MSTIGEIKDLVRAHFGQTGFSTTQLKFALDMGRREIEKGGNWWWMESEIDFNMIIGDNEYPIGDGVHIDAPDFKDLKALVFKEATETQWEPLEIGQYTKEELDVFFQTDEDGEPEVAVLVNDSLFFYPPVPDKAYNVRMYFWQWTDNPLDNNSEDIVTKRFPEALMYAGIAMGYEQVLKDTQQATYYKTLLGGQPFGKGGEIVKIRRENFKRGWKDQIIMVPRTGADWKHTRRSLDNIQIYPGRGTGWR